MSLPKVSNRRLGLRLPSQFPTTFAPASSLRVLRREEIVAFLKDKPSAFQRDKQFDKSWIMDQGDAGSCNGHAIASVLSKMRYLRGQPKVLLSGSDAYSQMNGGVDEGSELAAGMRVVQRNGIATLALNPTHRIFDWQVSRAAKGARARFKGFECLAIDDELELASFILLHGMVVVAVDVTDDFMELDAAGHPGGGGGPGNHAIHSDDVRLVGDQLEFRGVNSWGDWGLDGTCWLPFEQHLAVPIKNHRFYGLPEASTDPHSPAAALPVPKFAAA